MIEEFAKLAESISTRITLFGQESKNRKEIGLWITFPLEPTQKMVSLYHLESAFHNLGANESIKLFKDLIKLWRSCDINNADRAVTEACRIFGNIAHLVGRRLCFTLTANGQKFRCWYGIPGYITVDHIDSNGQGLLFEIKGKKKCVEPVVNAIVEEVLKESFTPNILELPNKTKVYGLRWEINRIY